ncbi:MAG: C10 family peptidase [Muribaculaceae bacterium]|nr:C10 family peptidase [Muribaculaceae bacterium]
MTHSLQHIAIFTAVGVCSVSCNNDVPSMESNLTSIAETSISNMVQDVYETVHTGTRAENNSYRIKSIDTQVYQIPDSLLITGTRGIDEKSYEIHTLTLDFGDTEGFTILSDTPGIEHVFYYTESGCIADTAKNDALKEMVEGTQLLALDILINGYGKESITRGSIDIEPLVPFQWHQGYPFNFYSTYCECSSCNSKFLRKHRPIGCVPIAVGQVIATVKKFTGTFYGNRDIDFDNLTKDGYILNDAEALPVAHFLEEVALNCQVKIRCDKSGTSAEAAARYLRDLGYLVDQKTEELDVDRFIRYLSRGVPQIAHGNNSSAGHSWILDGIKELNGSYLYHINWGQGVNHCDGWSSAYYYGTAHFDKEQEYKFYQYNKNKGFLYITL